MQLHITRGERNTCWKVANLFGSVSLPHSVLEKQMKISYAHELHADCGCHGGLRAHTSFAVGKSGKPVELPGAVFCDEPVRA